MSLVSSLEFLKSLGYTPLASVGTRMPLGCCSSVLVVWEDLVDASSLSQHHDAQFILDRKPLEKIQTKTIEGKKETE